MRCIIRLIILLLIAQPAISFAQPANTGDVDITGLWKGTLYNDTTAQVYSYEIGISSNKEKLSGFSHTWFLLGDKQYYGIKKVKVRRSGNKIIVEDDGLIANNYPVAPAKGIRQLNILELNVHDSVMTLTGPFSTNATRDYRPLTGTVSLQRKNDYWQSALVPHLQELGLLSKLSFITPGEQPVASGNAVIAKANRPDINNNTATETTTTMADPESLPAYKSDTVYSMSALRRPVEKIAAPEVKTTSVRGIAAAPVPSVNLPAIVHHNMPAADVSKRITVIQQTVSFTSDSLQLALYDNGEVDDDTVSVVMNGSVIMPKERLSTNAVRKTIFIPKLMDTVQLVMYAENLGFIPPNTGLLVVRDGKDLYEIRFSGDLQKNAAIIFNRKK